MGRGRHSCLGLVVIVVQYAVFLALRKDVCRYRSEKVPLENYHVNNNNTVTTTTTTTDSREQNAMGAHRTPRGASQKTAEKQTENKNAAPGRTQGLYTKTVFFFGGGRS